LMEVYGSARMEAACRRALRGSRFSYGSIKKILENNMDLLEDEHVQTEFLLPRHANLRGPEAYR
jgi:hypothetical protein